MVENSKNDYEKQLCYYTKNINTFRYYYQKFRCMIPLIGNKISFVRKYGSFKIMICELFIFGKANYNNTIGKFKN